MASTQSIAQVVKRVMMKMKMRRRKRRRAHGKTRKITRREASPRRAKHILGNR
jgi:hypothetical protein